MAAISRKKRIGYLIALIIMAGGTIGGYILTTYQIMNPDPEELAARQDMADLQARMNKYAEWQKKITEKYSAQYYPIFKEYEKSNKAFNAESVKELKTVDLKEGDGEAITAETAYQAYYIGWRADGKIFDSSFAGDSLKLPLEGGNMIEGWNQGVIGMKIGGVRELTIPAELAYGETGQGEDIPPNSPLKFIVMIIPPMSAEDIADRPEL